MAGCNPSIVVIEAPSACTASIVQDFTGFGRPWAHLADRVTGLRGLRIDVGVDAEADRRDLARPAGDAVEMFELARRHR